MIARHALVSVILSVACCVHIARAKSPSEPIQLFDGKTFTGWTSADGKSPPNNWTIEDGTLVVNGKGGSLYTADEYGDFDLSFQWKISPHGNSGVKYRSNFYKSGVYGHPGWLGCEYQILDDADEPANANNRSGVIYDLYPTTATAKLRPVGEFNDARIVVRGPQIEHWLNGVKVATAEIGSDEWKRRVSQSKFGTIKDFMQRPQGRIELQDHNRKAAFRNIVLTPLPSPTN